MATPAITIVSPSLPSSPPPTNPKPRKKKRKRRTYTRNPNNTHPLRRLLPPLKLRLADPLQRQFLALGHRGLQPDAGEALEGGGVAEAGEDVGLAGGALEGEGEEEGVLAVGGVGLWGAEDVGGRGGLRWGGGVGGEEIHY